MAFVPMVSSSPPPMTSEDLEASEDDDVPEMDSIADLDEEDEADNSADYDVTGMSNMLHMIPHDTIRQAPKDFLHAQSEDAKNCPPESPESPEPGLVNVVNGLSNHSSEIGDNLEEDPLPASPTPIRINGLKADNPSDLRLGNGDQLTVSNGDSFDQVDEVPDDSEPSENGGQNHVEKNHNVAEPENPESQWLSFDPVEDVPETCIDEEVTTKDVRPDLDHDKPETDYPRMDDNPQISKDDISVTKEADNQQFYCPSPDPVIPDMPPEKVGEDFDVDEADVDFGDFEAAFPQSEADQSEASEWKSEASESKSEALDLKFEPVELNKYDEDDFGDFESGPTWETFPEPSFGTMQKILDLLQPKIQETIQTLFKLEPTEDKHQAVNVKPLNYASSDLSGDDIWDQVCDIQSSPGLTLEWNKSKSHSTWLRSVKIDPNNMVFETRHRLKGSSGSAMPAFAIGMSGTGLLEPIRLNPDSVSKALEPSGTGPSQLPKRDKTDIPPAQFDWQTSGLTNPLEQGAQLKSPNAHRRKSPDLPPTSSTKETRPIAKTSPAQTILGSFPLLDFMQASALSKPRASASVSGDMASPWAQ